MKFPALGTSDLPYFRRIIERTSLRALLNAPVLSKTQSCGESRALESSLETYI